MARKRSIEEKSLDEVQGQNQLVEKVLQEIDRSPDIRDVVVEDLSLQKRERVYLSNLPDLPVELKKKLLSAKEAMTIVELTQCSLAISSRLIQENAKEPQAFEVALNSYLMMQLMFSLESLENQGNDLDENDKPLELTDNIYQFKIHCSVSSLPYGVGFR